MIWFNRAPVWVLLTLVTLTGGCSLFEGESFTNLTDANLFTSKPIDFSVLSQDTSELAGSWEWLQSTYYYTITGRPFVQKPEDVDHMKRLVFTPDDSVKVYRGEELWRKRCRQDYLDNSQWGTIQGFLVISRAHMDGPESIYFRAD